MGGKREQPYNLKCAHRIAMNKFNKNITMKSHTACVQPNLVLNLDELLFLEEQTCSEGTC